MRDEGGELAHALPEASGIDRAGEVGLFHGGSSFGRVAGGLIHFQVASGLTGLRIVPSSPGASLYGQSLGSESVSVAGGDGLTVTVEPR